MKKSGTKFQMRGGGAAVIEKSLPLLGVGFFGTLGFGDWMKERKRRLTALGASNRGQVPQPRTRGPRPLTEEKNLGRVE